MCFRVLLSLRFSVKISFEMSMTFCACLSTSSAAQFLRPNILLSFLFNAKLCDQSTGLVALLRKDLQGQKFVQLCT